MFTGLAFECKDVYFEMTFKMMEYCGTPYHDISSTQLLKTQHNDEVFKVHFMQK